MLVNCVCNLAIIAGVGLNTNIASVQFHVVSVHDIYVCWYCIPSTPWLGATNKSVRHSPARVCSYTKRWSHYIVSKQHMRASLCVLALRSAHTFFVAA